MVGQPDGCGKTILRTAVCSPSWAWSGYFGVVQDVGADHHVRETGFLWDFCTATGQLLQGTRAGLRSCDKCCNLLLMQTSESLACAGQCLGSLANHCLQPGSWQVVHMLRTCVRTCPCPLAGCCGHLGMWPALLLCCTCWVLQKHTCAEGKGTTAVSTKCHTVLLYWLSHPKSLTTLMSPPQRDNWVNHRLALAAAVSNWTPHHRSMPLLGADSWCALKTHVMQPSQA